jgi:predicted Zn-dependent protease
VDNRINLTSQWRSDIRWGRNRIATASDWRDNHLDIAGSASTNQVDALSLHAIVDLVHEQPRSQEPNPYWSNEAWAPVPSYPQTPIWSDATYAQTPADRSTIAAQLVAVAEQAGMLSAGYLSIEARGTTYAYDDDPFLYAPQTIAQCSLTVRDPQGTGSGWAGASSHDWGRIDAPKLAAIAVDKCLKSRNPVKLEPGRYTTILEPQAGYELLYKVFRPDPSALDLDRDINEGIENPYRPLPFSVPKLMKFTLGRYGGVIGYRKTRLGEQVFDPRLSIRSDPLDPALGTLPFTKDGDPYVQVTWMEHGVLTTLAYDSRYAFEKLRDPVGKPWSGAFRVEGSTPPVSIEEMIATTKRGLWVTRFWDIQLLDDASALCTGLTRDGLWLIENGQVSHPVQNFRFTESPMFAFNNVEQIGTPVPVFNPECPAVMPAVKVRDFSFTSLVDAV